MRRVVPFVFSFALILIALPLRAQEETCRSGYLVATGGVCVPADEAISEADEAHGIQSFVRDTLLALVKQVKASIGREGEKPPRQAEILQDRQRSSVPHR